MNYLDAIQGHKKLNFNQISEFCREQSLALGLDNYVNSVTVESLFSAIAAYSTLEKNICISDEFKKYLKNMQKENSNLLDAFFCNYNDLYNLFVIECIYHELWHAKQQKELEENKYSDYSTLINSSIKFKEMSGSMYRYYHHRYYFEYDAIINSILLTLGFVKPFDLDEIALNIINRNFATEILMGYGISDERILKSGYNSPIVFNNYLIDELEDCVDINRLKHRLKYIIENYQVFDSNFENLIKGNVVPEYIIDKLKDVKNGKKKVTSIVEVLGDDIKNIHR